MMHCELMMWRCNPLLASPEGRDFALLASPEGRDFALLASPEGRDNSLPDLPKEEEKSPSFGGVGEEKSPLLGQAQHKTVREHVTLSPEVGEDFKMLVIQQKMIGDVLVSSLICENLKKTYPNAEIHYVANRFTLPVIENNPFIDQIIVFEEEYQQSKYQLLKFLIGIRKSRYNLIIDAYAKIESKLITLFSGAETKISWKKSRRQFIYTHVVERLKIPQTDAGLAIEDRLNLLSPLRLTKKLQHKPKIYLTEHEKEKAKSKLNQFNIDDSQPLFMIGVLGSEEAKTYPLDKMAKVLDFLVAKTNAQLIFNYMPKQREKAAEVYKFCEKSTQQHIHLELIPSSLREFMALTHHCDALLSNEGGAVNMAKALDIPTFTIFSPWINPKAWASFEDGVKNVSVHLKDIEPELYNKTSFKALKTKSESLYRRFDETKIISALHHFLKGLQFKIVR